MMLRMIQATFQKRIIKICCQSFKSRVGTDYIHDEPLNNYFRIYSDKIGL